MELELGDRIRELRIKKDYTQDQLGEVIGMQRSGVAKYESNVNMPPGDVLLKLADLFKVSVDYLLGRTKNPHETYKAESELTHEDEEKLRVSLAKIESMMRELSGLSGVDEVKLKKAMDIFEWTFREDLDKKK